MAMLPPMVLDRASAGRWRDTEWLLTNGLGGYALGTALGMPTRRYHALLVGPRSRRPWVASWRSTRWWPRSCSTPVGVMSSDSNSRSTRFHDGTEHPRGGQWLTQFALKEAGTLAEWTWQVHGPVRPRGRIRLEDCQVSAARAGRECRGPSLSGDAC
jgi:hypothetical protein